MCRAEGETAATQNQVRSKRGRRSVFKVGVFDFCHCFGAHITDSTMLRGWVCACGDLEEDKSKQETKEYHHEMDRTASRLESVLE